MPISDAVRERFEDVKKKALKELNRHDEFDGDGSRTYIGNSLPFGDDLILYRDGRYVSRVDQTGFPLGEFDADKVAQGQQLYFQFNGTDITEDRALEGMISDLERAVERRIEEGPNY